MVQVGPVARVLMAYAQGHERTVELVDRARTALGIELAQLNSTAGRTLCRAIEAVTSAEMLAQTTFQRLVDNLRRGDIDVFDAARWEPSSWPKKSSGYSFVEVARGNLSHWVTIEDGTISRYQAVVPTTWLAGGRDDSGTQGPYEGKVVSIGGLSQARLMALAAARVNGDEDPVTTALADALAANHPDIAAPAVWLHDVDPAHPDRRYSLVRVRHLAQYDGSTRDVVVMRGELDAVVRSSAASRVDRALVRKNADFVSRRGERPFAVAAAPVATDGTVGEFVL